MLIPIILSGGSGTRLWPVSRQQMPKPFMKILDNKTLLAHTLERAIALDKVTDVITLTNKDYYHLKVKRIEVYPQQHLSLQMHHHRSEHWVVVTGTAQVINDDKELTLNANESTYIPAGHKHRLSNLTDEKLEIIEVQTGSYVGEDDIVRFEDIYGR